MVKSRYDDLVGESSHVKAAAGEGRLSIALAFPEEARRTIVRRLNKSKTGSGPWEQ